MTDDSTSPRYEMRPSSATGYWMICDIETGEIAKVNDTWLDMLTIEEADDAVDLLNRLDAEQRGSTKQ
jgi:hypothetical protein